MLISDWLVLGDMAVLLLTAKKAGKMAPDQNWASVSKKERGGCIVGHSQQSLLQGPCFHHSLPFLLLILLIFPNVESLNQSGSGRSSRGGGRENYIQMFAYPFQSFLFDTAIWLLVLREKKWGMLSFSTSAKSLK